MSSFYKNSFYYLSSTFIVKVAGILLLPFYTRLIDPSEFGVIFLLVTGGMLLSTLAQFSFRAVVSRFYFECKTAEEVKQLYSTCLIFVTILSIVIFGASLSGSGWINTYLKIGKIEYIYLALAGAFFGMYYQIYIGLLYMKEKSKQASLLNGITGISNIILTLVCVIIFKDKISGYLTALLLSNIIMFIFFLVGLKEYGTIAISLRGTGKYLRYASANIFTELSSYLVTFADRFMLSKMTGNAATGIYSTGYRFGQAVEVVYHSINKAYVPKMYQGYQEIHNKEKQVAKLSLNVFGLFTVLATLFILISPEFVLLLDEDYSAGKVIIPIIIISYLLNGYKLVFHNPLSYNIKFVKYKSMIWMSAAVINIGLNLLLIPDYGIKGAALATLASYLITFSVVLIVANKALKIHYDWRKFIIIFIVSMAIWFLIALPVNFFTILIKLTVYILYCLIVTKLCDVSITNVLRIIKGKFNEDFNLK